MCSLLARVILFKIYLSWPESRDLPSTHLHWVRKWWEKRYFNYRLPLPPRLHVLCKAQQGLLSLLGHNRDFFPCWCAKVSFFLLVCKRIFFPCWCFTGSFFLCWWFTSHDLLSLPVLQKISNFKILLWQPTNWLCWGLTTRQPLWVILCRLPEKGRKEIVEEMKETIREETVTGMKVKRQKK